MLYTIKETVARKRPEKTAETYRLPSWGSVSILIAQFPASLQLSAPFVSFQVKFNFNFLQKNPRTPDLMITRKFPVLLCVLT